MRETLLLEEIFKIPHVDFFPPIILLSLDIGRVYKMYKIPKEVLKTFHHVSANNRLENGKHIETLAFLFGYKSESNFIGTHLIFPEQEGTCSRVDDKGKFFCIPSIFNVK